jgi:hypothetical protein
MRRRVAGAPKYIATVQHRTECDCCLECAAAPRLPRLSAAFDRNTPRAQAQLYSVLPDDFHRLRLFDIAGNSLDWVFGGDLTRLVLGCVAGVAFPQRCGTNGLLYSGEMLHVEAVLRHLATQSAG